MDDYNKLLAENVLTEDKVVTYRLLSRTLQVHANTAKQMLYEFHRTQNARRPGAVHATYLVYGTKNAAGGLSAGQNGPDGDIDMTSSAPEVESLADTVPILTLSLVPEERLNESLAEYDEVSSIHVYSIGPHPTKDFALLADAANEVLGLGAGNDGNSIATITNPWVRRRERQGAGPKTAAASAVKPRAKPIVSKVAQALAPAKVKEEAKPPQPAQNTADKTTSSAPTKKPAPTLKRGAGSGGIMQAFSKAAAKPKKAQPAPTPPSGGDDSTMQAMSDDGEDDAEMPQPKARRTSGSKSRKEREEALKRMMEEDDDEEEEPSEKEESPVEEPMEEEPPVPELAKEEETEIGTTSTNGRRRGRRKVMRKKQITDTEGYLVTIQEPGWESFSEDEPPPRTKPKTISSTLPVQAASKKGGQKTGQGSIMSFFSKK
ncbi:hypothetical protein BT67DRAFT_310439 [Trichocladium antarcticum]|uniref:DNA polymerase delta subunit 3 n=1 Tax=Trichocladium antarcticum TaxID=1450529 RepID=A0AAN6UJJ9_9PEZI|nr:hypothetical protein BT67DRAFT_310439 [Trichocladium antarcticum]